MDSRIWINGVLSDGTIPVTDSSILRGDGCFEVLRSYGGRVFSLDRHLDRLERSASKMMIPIPDRHEISRWVNWAAEDHPDGSVRIVVTRGSAIPGTVPEPRVIVFSHPWNRDGSATTLMPVSAPWHSAGIEWELSGVKVLSYAPNLAATRSARTHGFGDALLISRDGVILEGPTFSVAWVIDGILETPTLELGILDSITRRVILEIANEFGIPTATGRWDSPRLEEAAEVMALSTIREVQAVTGVGRLEFSPGSVTRRLSDGLTQASRSKPTS